MKALFSTLGLLAVLAMPFSIAPATTANAAPASEIDIDVKATMDKFKAGVAGADKLLEASKAQLVFPNIVEGAFVFGAEYGEGALLKGGDTEGYYSFFSASFGFQAGAQSKSVIMLFMTDDALETLKERDGWEIGADAEVAVLDEGVSGEITSTTFNQPVVAVVLEQRGLLAGVSLNGAKVTEIRR